MLITYEEKLKLYKKHALSFYKRPFFLNIEIKPNLPFGDKIFISLHYKNKFLRNFFDPPVWFKCQIKTNHTIAVFTEHQGYMKTSTFYKKKNLQETLQAIVYDLFDVQEIRFEQTLPAGKKFIEHSSLFIIDKCSDLTISCKINQEYLEKIINGFILKNLK